MKRIYRQPVVGRRVRELREQAGLSRAGLARAAAVTTSAVERLETGADVRLSTYLPVIDYFLSKDPRAWMLADRIVLLPAAPRAQIKGLVAWFGGSDPDEGASDE